MPSERQIEEQRRRRQAFWPLFGLLMAVALAVIAWVLAPVVIQFLRDQQPNRFSFGDLTFEQVQLIFAGIIFLVLGALTTLILAIFAPKKKTMVKDSSLKKEKKQLEAEQKARRARQMALEAEMRKQNRERNKK